jgi:pimeloyl-ACP methyl ester carboxylesterase
LTGLFPSFVLERSACKVEAGLWCPFDAGRVGRLSPENHPKDNDVAAAKRILDLQDGPTLLVGHSYGGSIITEAGVHPNVVGLVYVAAHAPDVAWKTKPSWGIVAGNDQIINPDLER